MVNIKKAHTWLAGVLIIPFLMVGFLCCCTSSAEAASVMSVQQQEHDCCDKNQVQHNASKTKPCDQTQCQKQTYTLEPDAVLLSSNVLDHIMWEGSSHWAVIVYSAPKALVIRHFDQDVLAWATYPALYIDHQQFLL